MPLILYGSNVSPPTRATLMLINILGVDVKFKEVNLPTRDHLRPEYLEKNPLHTIPMLEDDGYRIVDSHAILTYLVTKFGREELYPKNLKTRCSVDQRLFFDATILFPRLRVVIYDIAEKKSGLTETHKMKIKEAYDATEKYLEQTKYIASDSLSVADLSCVSSISSLNAIVPVGENYVKLLAWWSMLKKEEWYQQNVPGNKTFAMFMSSLLRR
jgi:glutathione S-transferase